MFSEVVFHLATWPYEQWSGTVPQLSSHGIHFLIHPAVCATSYTNLCCARACILAFHVEYALSRNPVCGLLVLQGIYDLKSPTIKTRYVKQVTIISMFTVVGQMWRHPDMVQTGYSVEQVLVMTILLKPSDIVSLSRYYSPSHLDLSNFGELLFQNVHRIPRFPGFL